MNNQDIQFAQLRLCYESIPAGQVAVVLAGVSVVAFMYPVTDLPILVAWSIALLLVCVFRIGSFLAFRKAHRADDEVLTWDRINLAGALILGSVWGAAGFFLFPSDSIAHQSLLAFIIAGMAAGGVTSLSVHLPAAVGFVLTSVTPLAFRLILTSHEFGIAMGIMAILFLFMLLIAAARFYGNYRNMLIESRRREIAESELEKIAYFDPLTSLPNRRLYSDHMARAIAAAQRRGGRLAVCYLDLDRFKPINDEHGHETGDKILVQVGRKIKSVIRTEDVVARWGGDEFAILLTAVTDEQECLHTLQRVIDALNDPYEIDDKIFSLSATIGVAVYPDHGADTDTLLRHADHAMYLAKRAGRNRLQLFTVSSDSAQQGESVIGDEISAAIAGDELTLHYQPKVDMLSGQVYGFEALLRWNHPERGLLAPAQFVETWESDSAMAMVDQWVIRSAASQLSAWVEGGLDVNVSVNVSAWLLSDEKLIEEIRNVLGRHPRARNRLEIEITETRALHDIDHVSDVMRSCAAEDVAFSLDDFGTGFSSLLHLQRLPAKGIKIDAGFVIGMLDDRNDFNLVKGIIGIADGLGKEVVAEGVESVAHGAALIGLGCRRAQGYGISKPMPVDEILQWCAKYRAPAEWRETLVLVNAI